MRLHLPPTETIQIAPSLLGAMLGHARKRKAIDRIELLDLLQTAALEPYDRESPCRKLRAQIIREHGLESPPDTTTAGDLLALYAEQHCPDRLAELFDHTPLSSPSP